MNYKINTLILFLLLFFTFNTLQAQKVASGNALDFVGTDDNITLASYPSITTNFTISSWIKPDVLIAGQQIFSIGHSNELFQSMQFRLDGEVLEFGANTGSPSMEKVTSIFPVDASRWNHVAVVYDNTSVVLYINGEEAGTGTVDLSALNVDVCHIAAKIDKMESSFFFDGQIDEVCFWSASLTQTELRATMYEELAGDETNLEAYYNFNATTGTTLEDNTTAGTNSGVLTNMIGDEWTESYALIVPTPQDASDITPNSFTANWTAPSVGTADGYYLDVSLESNFSNFIIENENISTTSSSVTGLTIGTTYYYRVRSYVSNLGDIGTWHYSNPISVFTEETPQPTTQATNIVVSDITNSTMTLDWTRGDGENCVVFALEGNTGIATPTDGTAYTADAQFAVGDQAGTSGWYCIYNGSGTNVTTTSLAALTEYRFMVIEYNDGVSQENYFLNTSTGNPINATTLTGIEAPGTQAGSVEVTDIQYNQATISWTNGNGEGRAVFLYQGNTSEPEPNNDITYSDNSIFTNGDEINASGWYCIYNGTANEITVTGLEELTKYRVMVVEYNGTSGSEKYLATSMDDNPINFETIKYVIAAEEVEVTNFISPDGDGTNDFLIIAGLELLSEYELFILNNLGEILYETDNYENDWDATYNGNNLPNGTYYYIIKYDGGAVKGTITVVN